MMLRSLLRPEVHEFLLELAAHPEFLEGFQGSVDAKGLANLANYAAQMTPADFESQIEALNDWYRALEHLSRSPRQQRDAEVSRIEEETLRSRSPQRPGQNAILAQFWPAVAPSLQRLTASEHFIEARNV